MQFFHLDFGWWHLCSKKSLVFVLLCAMLTWQRRYHLKKPKSIVGTQRSAVLRWCHHVVSVRLHGFIFQCSRMRRRLEMWLNKQRCFQFTRGERSLAYFSNTQGWNLHNNKYFNRSWAQVCDVRLLQITSDTKMGVLVPQLEFNTSKDFFFVICIL